MNNHIAQTLADLQTKIDALIELREAIERTFATGGEPADEVPKAPVKRKRRPKHEIDAMLKHLGHC